MEPQAFLTILPSPQHPTSTQGEGQAMKCGQTLIKVTYLLTATPIQD